MSWEPKGSKTSRRDKQSAVEPSRFPRSRCVCIVRGNTSSPPGIIKCPRGAFYYTQWNETVRPHRNRRLRWIRTAAKRRTGVRRFARMRKFSMVFIAHPRVVTRFSPLQNGVYTLARHRRAFNAYCIHAETSTGAKNLTFTKITITYEPNKGSPMNRI